MAREFKRTDRLGDAIQRSLAQLIQFEIRDPRIGMVNINDVVVSRDLSNAKVYIAFVGEDDAERSQEGVDVLNKAAGFLRSQLSRELDTRTTPRLQFVYDRTAIDGNAMSRLIDQAVAADKHDPDGE
ncbi:MAG: 30S ribosome-binding factor RbfA [Cellvibrionaceae bacterium]|nr:30S ribosome-binding factor RbfA [Cellvibrionaceae bacterium]